MSAGCVLVCKFIANSPKAFKKYIDYIDREEASKNNKDQAYSDYSEYMENPEKSTGLFTKDNDQLSLNEKKILKDQFKQAQDNGSIMLQSVFSFTWDWLKETGLADEENNLNEDLLKKYTRSAMDTLIKKENLDTFVWSAAIHYNTEHIHIHIAATEPTPSWKEGQGRCRRNNNGELYQRGKITPSSVDAMKSKFVNMALNEADVNIRVSKLIRENIVLAKREMSLYGNPNPEVRNKFIEFYNSLPKENLNEMYYKHSAMNPHLPALHQLCDVFIEAYCADEFKELNEILGNVSEDYFKAYGNQSGSEAFSKSEEFKNNKINDMYYRLGNAILQECRELTKKEKTSQSFLRFNHEFPNHSLAPSSIHINRAIYLIKKALRKDIETLKNQSIYERTQMDLDNDYTY